MANWFHELSRIAPVVIILIYIVQFLETEKLEEIRDENFGENQKEFEANLLGQAYQYQPIELPGSTQREENDRRSSKEITALVQLFIRPTKDCPITVRNTYHVIVESQSVRRKLSRDSEDPCLELRR